MNIKKIIISTCLSSLSAITYAAPTFFSGIDWSYDPSGNVVINSGYYDVNKKFDTTTRSWVTSDAPLCWAATSSNIIQHWQDRVRAQYGGLPSGIPDGVGTSYDLAIYESIKAGFPSVGSHLNAAASWYFLNDYPGTLTEGGYWLPYLPDGIKWSDPSFTSVVYLNSKDAWAQFFTTDAQLPVLLGVSGATGHAVTLYGYEYSSSDAVRLWLADSDDLYEGLQSYDLTYNTVVGSWEFDDDAKHIASFDGRNYLIDYSDYSVHSVQMLNLSTENLLAIPEPASCIVLFGLGVFSFTIIRKRKKL